MFSNEKLENLLSARDPAVYAECAVLQRLVATELLARLDFVTLQPRVIVDMGCGVGDVSTLLRTRYRDANIMAVDASFAMLSYAKQQKNDADWLCASVDRIPFASHSVDLIVANLLLPWCTDLQAVCAEWQRILRPDGLLMLTMLGPDTLRELHPSTLFFPQLMDMHNLGDLLTQQKFAHPVLEADYFTLTYRDSRQLFHELRATSMMSGDGDKVQLEKNSQNVYPLTFEVIFAHAFGTSFDAQHVVDESGEVRIPLSHILRQKKAL